MSSAGCLVEMPRVERRENGGRSFERRCDIGQEGEDVRDVEVALRREASDRTPCWSGHHAYDQRLPPGARAQPCKRASGKRSRRWLERDDLQARGKVAGLIWKAVSKNADLVPCDQLLN